MSQMEYDALQEPAQQSNGLAIAGFVCSLVGLFTGILSPVGLILSLVALGRPGGRGWAIAGIIIGLVGTCGGVIVVILLVVGGLAALGLAAFGAAAFVAMGEPERAQITADMAVIAVALVAEREGQGALPATLTELGLDTPILTDPWGNPYRYLLQTDTDRGFDLVSNGSDGSPGTRDDIQLSKLTEYWEAAKNLDMGLTSGEEGRRVEFRFGDRTILITGGEQGDRITVDLGDRVIEIRGDDEGGVVTVTPKSGDDTSTRPDDSGEED